MEENFYKDDFEKFLQEQANNHRMFPSDRVWGNIHSKLHADKNWPALTIAALGFLAAIIAIGIYFSPKPNIFAYKTVETAKTNRLNPSPNSLSSSVTNNPDKKVTAWAFDEVNPSLKNQPLEAPLTETVISEKPLASAAKSNSSATNIVIETARTKTIASSINTNTTKAEPKAGSPASKELLVSNSVPTGIDPDDQASEELEQIVDFNAQKNSIIYNKEQEKTFPAIELGTKPKAQKNKQRSFKNNFSYLVYITPSASFRRLKEDGSLLNQKVANTSGPVDISNVADVNRVVRHAPGTGAEAGVNFRYNLSKNLKVTTGLQFNIRQYSMEAFIAGGELTTIALQRTSGIRSITKYSYYRTSNGLATTELVNRYYQVSMPIGLEWEVIGSKHIGFNVAAAVQPTYNLNTNSYLISTNFKHYTESGAILRNWNLNTNIEAFVNFKNGDYRWQIGPQFRYQQFSSFIKAYPIKENLLDYGVKIGVSKVIQ